MTRSSADQARSKRNCFNAHRYEHDGKALLTCHLCNGIINPANESWIAEHVVRHSVGGSDDPSNVFPAHRACAAKKDAIDISENAKGKRVSDKHFGIVNKRGWWKPDGYNRRKCATLAAQPHDLVERGILKGLLAPCPYSHAGLAQHPSRVAHVHAVRGAVTAGFTQVLWMRGGFREWSSAGLPVEQ